MVILFSWRKILRQAGRGSKRILRVLEIIAFNEQPRSIWDPDYKLKIKEYSGQSFLVNLYGLLAKKSLYSAKEIAEYVSLASLRNYAHYSATKDTTLELLHSPVSEEIINKNRLLSVRNGRIHFKYEEVT